MISVSAKYGSPCQFPNKYRAQAWRAILFNKVTLAERALLVSVYRQFTAHFVERLHGFARRRVARFQQAEKSADKGRLQNRLFGQRQFGIVLNRQTPCRGINKHLIARLSARPAMGGSCRCLLKPLICRRKAFFQADFMAPAQAADFRNIIVVCHRVWRRRSARHPQSRRLF